MITREEVQKLAELSLIEVSSDELETIAGEMDAIIGYVSEVTSLATEKGVREKPPLYNVMRDDVVTNTPGQYTDALLNEAPDRDGNYLRVKKIL
jgi:aspartyl-tRNA(Asn)/glutamyl-tRNA(Gln) amidotransferase subunit C